MFGLLIAIIYLSFISLGLPDSLLGAAWPIMHEELNAPLSYAGFVSMVICAGTVASSLLSDRLTKKFGASVVTAVSVAVTALSLFLFSVSSQVWMLFLFAVPYGLGAGGVDAALNNYVALHLKSRHMSWLHCMWGVGAAVSPYIMGYAITGGTGWRQGYWIVSIVQAVISAVIFISLPIWKRGRSDKAENGIKNTSVPIKEVLHIPGAISCFIGFFCYCAYEQTTMLWASSYMIAYNGIGAELAASLASLFFIGITVGRGVNGFLTFKFSDKTLIRVGAAVVAVGVVFIAVPGVDMLTFIGFTVIGLGSAPIYPSIIHSTPQLFGEDKSQAVIGMQMASAYLGSCFAPPIYGLLANHVSQLTLPYYIFVFLAVMVIMHEITVKKRKMFAAPITVSADETKASEPNA